MGESQRIGRSAEEWGGHGRAREVSRGVRRDVEEWEGCGGFGRSTEGCGGMGELRMFGKSAEGWREWQDCGGFGKSSE
eukprot:9484726-Pyramimonas_sp.AAC.1